MGRKIALLAIAGALLLPGSSAVAGDGPVAIRSGALINYVSTGRLRVGKTMEIRVVCSADCNVTSRVVIKGPGLKTSSMVSGPLAAGVPGGHILKPNGPLLKSMKADTGRFRLVSHMTATDASTGAMDNIAHTFKLKR
jgi:hypothetical protein